MLTSEYNRAYNQLYLDNAMFTLATMLDYAVHIKNRNIDEFFVEFVHSRYCYLFEKGDPSVVSGTSGVELYSLVTADFNILPYISLNRTAEYWLGWSLAYYQWYTNTTFRTIHSRINLYEMLNWYSTLHEADLSTFVDYLNSKITSPQTNLKHLRERAGLTQSMLSQLSGVPQRTIQLYEQRINDISKAQFNILYALARVLNCTVYDLAEQNGQMCYTMANQYYIQDNFLLQLNQRIMDNNLRLSRLQAEIAQRQAYAYAYTSQFPYQQLRYANNHYQIPWSAYSKNWNNYWNNLLLQQQARENQREIQQLLKKIGLEVLTRSAKDAGNTWDLVFFDTLGIITADNLAEAISKAISIIEVTKIQNL